MGPALSAADPAVQEVVRGQVGPVRDADRVPPPPGIGVVVVRDGKIDSKGRNLGQFTVHREVKYILPKLSQGFDPHVYYTANKPLCVYLTPSMTVFPWSHDSSSETEISTLGGGELLEGDFDVGDEDASSLFQMNLPIFLFLFFLPFLPLLPEEAFLRREARRKWDFVCLAEEEAREREMLPLFLSRQVCVLFLLPSPEQ